MRGTERGRGRGRGREMERGRGRWKGRGRGIRHALHVCFASAVLLRE
jgi:hypothetical protein